MNKGIIPINKPKDWTSFDVCNKIKHMVRPAKVGHLGTLDPMATGVLLVTIGKATKLFDLMQEKQKTYVAEFEFGVSTDTLDATGTVLSKSQYCPTEQELQNVLHNFVGKINQIPPKYSAKNVNGKRAYELARSNEEFELKPKEVEVYNIELLKYETPFVTLKITCGSGTYIRAIGRDIAASFNTVATMTSLVRSSVGKFSIEKCINIENLSADNIQSNIISVDKVLDYGAIEYSKENTFKLLNGQKVTVSENDGNYCLKDGENIVAIVKVENFVAKMSIFLGWPFGKMQNMWYNKKDKNFKENKIMITAGDIRKGVIFDDGTSTDPKKPSLYLVTDFQHVKPGKGAAFVRTTLKHVLTGKVIERTYNPSEKVNDITIERKEMMYLYNEGGLYYFMDNETYDQIPFNYDSVKDALNFVVENTNCQVQFYNGQPINVEPPIFVELTITKAEPGVRGDTVKTGGKPATLETGYVIQVPLFVNEGDRVRVDTRTGEYMERL